MRRTARRSRRSRRPPPASSATTARTRTPASKPLFLTSARSPARSRAATSRCTSRAGTGAACSSMLGQSLDQTFTYDDGTIFLLWQGKVPTVIDASQLQAGDRITVRIRAPRERDARPGRGDARRARGRPRAGRSVDAELATSSRGKPLRPAPCRPRRVGGPRRLAACRARPNSKTPARASHRPPTAGSS